MYARLHLYSIDHIYRTIILFYRTFFENITIFLHRKCCRLSTLPLFSIRQRQFLGTQLPKMFRPYRLFTVKKSKNLPHRQKSHFLTYKFLLIVSFLLKCLPPLCSVKMSKRRKTFDKYIKYIILKYTKLQVSFLISQKIETGFSFLSGISAAI